MNPTPVATLDALHDIHLPAAVGLWPLAPAGWLLIAIALLSVTAFGLYRWQQRRQNARWQTACLKELESLEGVFAATRDATALASELSTLLRRIALARSPRDEVAALQGDAWITYWCPQDADVDEATTRAMREITETAYRGSPEADMQPVCWIDSVRARIREVA